MGFLGFGRKKGVVDLGERFRKQQERAAQMHTESSVTPAVSETQSQETSSGGMFGFFNNTTPTTPSSSSEEIETINPGEKRRKLAKRLMDMTTKIEDLSNQIYHLQQRIEVLERKSDVNPY